MMRRAGPDLLRWISIGMLLLAAGLIFFTLLSYSRKRARLPDDMIVGGVPLGSLDQSEALEKLLQAYSMPVELLYEDDRIHLNPSEIGFQLDTEAMLAVAELQRTETDFWAGYWEFLWNRLGDPVIIPVKSDFSSTQLESYLMDISVRYDEPSVAAQPVPGSPAFVGGEQGKVLDIRRASELIGDALNQPLRRQVRLPVVASQPPRPAMATLETLIKQIVEVEEFSGLTMLYVMDLRTGEELNLAFREGVDLPTEPGISVTAGSTVKIPIAAAFYRYFDEPLDEEADRWMSEMITLSGNDTADWLMERIDPVQGPLVVSDSMNELGLESTFLAGYFRLGSDLLRVYRTPGNQRTDINTRPDIYNQTTVAEMGILLADLYRCTDGGGALLAAFPNELKPSECQKILELMAQNKIGVLIESGVPEGTRVAHKHGWTGSPLDWIGDVGIVYTPGGDYVIAMFLWNEPEMIWDPTSKLMADLSQAVYGFFNPPG